VLDAARRLRPPKLQGPHVQLVHFAELHVGRGALQADGNQLSPLAQQLAFVLVGGLRRVVGQSLRKWSASFPSLPYASMAEGTSVLMAPTSRCCSAAAGSSLSYPCTLVLATKYCVSW